MTERSPNLKNSTSQFLLVGLISALLFGGIGYELGHSANKAMPNTLPGGQQAGGNFGGRRFGQGSLGTVSAISSTSITVNDSRSGTAKTYTINSSTSIANNGASATVGDISDGTTVLVTPSTTDASIASRIMLNPSFGGGNLPSSSSSGSSSDSQTYTN
jgi:hypothetical protein